LQQHLIRLEDAAMFIHQPDGKHRIRHRSSKTSSSSRVLGKKKAAELD
jgi:uncharacterized membrane protein